MQQLKDMIVSRLISEFRFNEYQSDKGTHLRDGMCPECGKKTLWTWKDSPGMVQCNRTERCAWQATSKELFPDIFEHLNKKYPATEQHPTATADVYLQLVRGFDIAKISGWYDQGKWWHPNADHGTATVRFKLKEDVYFDRFVEECIITNEDGSSETRTKAFKGAFGGLWWAPPTLTIEHGDEIAWCEGILDAIALNLSGIKAVAIMSSGTFPSDSIQAFLKRNITWLIALDNDKTGRKSLHKHAQKLRSMGEKVTAMLSSESEHKNDWNDLYKRNALTQKDLAHYRYLGHLELADHHLQKARIIWKHNPKQTYFVFAFKNATYSCQVEKEEYEKKMGEVSEEILEEWLQPDDNVFVSCSKVKQIATFKLDFLYFQQPENGDDGQYFFRINFSNVAPVAQLPFSGKTFGSASDFKKAIMQKTPSALFTGATKDLDELYKGWMLNIPRVVKTLDFIGYDRATKAYVFNNYAVENGKLLQLNNEDFFQLAKTGIKTTVDIKQQLSDKFNSAWLDDFKTAFGIKGMVTLTWWFGSLFAEQIYQHYVSYPFLELVGEAGSGKSDLVAFLWKLLGRDSDTFNPNLSTLAGRIRKLASVSNMPTVFNETDNEKISEDRHQRKFDWEELKDLYEGNMGAYRGRKTQDNSTYNPSFKSALMIVQNIAVEASEAIRGRIVHVYFDCSHHSPAGKAASERLNDLETLEVSGFLLSCIKQEKDILQLFEERFKRYRSTLQANALLKNQRIKENHAKLMALADCMQLILPFSDADLAKLRVNLIALAEERQEALSDEHPDIEKFFNRLDYIDSRQSAGGVIEQHLVNHHKEPESYIAINFESFNARSYELTKETFDESKLRKLFPSAKRFKYIENKKIRSRIEGRPLNCWVFKRS